MKIKKLLAIFLIFMLGCARGSVAPENVARVTDPRLSGSDQREVEMGKQIHQAIVSSFQVYTEPRLVEYVKEIGASVAKSAERRSFSYQFTVLYDDRAYATEAPGGFVYITTGFLNFLQNEAELAGLLASEVAMLQFRDPRFSIPRRALGAVAQTGAVIGPFFGQIGALATSAIVLLQAFTESTIASAQEKLWGSDERALHYMVDAGHDPQGYLDLLSRFINADPEWSPFMYDYLTSRPVTLKRYQKVLAEFEKLPLEEKSFTVNRERYLEMTRGVREIYKGQ